MTAPWDRMHQCPWCKNTCRIYPALCPDCHAAMHNLLLGHHVQRSIDYLRLANKPQKETTDE